MKTDYLANNIKIIIIILSIMLILVLPMQFSFAENDLFTASDVTYNTTYHEILDMYIETLNAYERYDPGEHDLFNELIISDFDSDYESPMKNRIAETKSKVGFCIFDLNHDGIDELIIGENPSYIFEVFTIENGRIRELVRAGYHYDCTLLENGQFYRVAKDGAAWNSFTIWEMNGTGKVTFVDGYIRDEEPSDRSLGGHNNALLFFKMTDSQMRNGTIDNLVSCDQFLTWMKNVEQKVLQFYFIPLEFFEQTSESDYSKIGIVSVDGRTSGESYVRIRTEPNRRAKVLQKCKVGTYVIIDDEEEGYYKVRLNYRVGFMQKEYVTFLDNSNNGKKYGIDYESYKNWISELSDSSLSITPEEAMSTGEMDLSTDNNEEYVLDHYETVEVQRSRLVLDHYETSYTYEDDGLGHFIEVPHELPVYRTEYYTETVQQPIYRRFDE